MRAFCIGTCGMFVRLELGRFKWNKLVFIPMKSAEKFVICGCNQPN